MENHYEKINNKKVKERDIKGSEIYGDSDW